MRSCLCERERECRVYNPGSERLTSVHIEYLTYNEVFTSKRNPQLQQHEECE